MFQLVYCVGGSLKNLCHFEMGDLVNADVLRGRSMLTGGGKICQNLADVICERPLGVSGVLKHARELFK